MFFYIYSCCHHTEETEWTPPQFGLGVETDDATHTPKGSEMFLPCIVRLSGEEKNRFLSLPPKTLGEQGKEAKFGIVLWLGDETEMRVLTSTKGGKNQIFLSACPDVAWKGKRSGKT